MCVDDTLEYTHDLLDLHSRPFMCHVHLHWRDPIPSFIERDIERTERDMYRRSCSKDHVSRFTRWWWSFCFSLHLFLMFSWLSSTHLHHSLLMISWRITDRHTMFPMVVLFPFPSFSAAETTSTIRSNTFASLSLSTTNNLLGRQQRYRCIKYDEQDY